MGHDLRGNKMRKTAIVSLVSMLVLSFAYSIAEAGLFEEKLQVIDSEYQDEVFGGSKQSTLIISFTPGDDLAADGDYAVIVDVDDDGDFDDEPSASYIATGTATPDTAVSLSWNINSKLSSLNDGDYDIAVVIDETADGDIDWDNADDDTENFTLDRTLEITEVAVVPEIFSPNGDGVKDTVTIHYTLSEMLSGVNEDVVITIGEGDLAVAAKPIAGVSAGQNSVIWDGRDGLGNYAADREEYDITIEAKDRGGNEKTKTIKVKVCTEAPDVISTEPEACLLIFMYTL